MTPSRRVLFWSLAVALGGFLFGFDTVVISGAERAIQALWQLTSIQHGLTIAIALVGTVFGALFGGRPAETYGRRTTLIGIAILYLVSSVGAAFAPSWPAFLFFRLLGGLGVGASSVAAPLYISEVAAAKSRGRMVGLFQFNIVFGMVVAYLSNYLLSGIGENAWRWMLGIQAIPSVFFLVMLLGIPESPRWVLRRRNDVEGARKTLAIIDPDNADAIIASLKETREAGHAVEPLFCRANLRPILLAMTFAFFNQVSGINAILYFAPRIFQMAGLGSRASLLSSAGVGIVNFVFTLLAVSIIDRFGRRRLMLVGSFGLITTLALVANAFHAQHLDGMLVPVYLFVYIAFFAFSQGAVIWVFISEIFPNAVRAEGQALGSFTHWFMATVITFTFPYVAEHLGGTVVFGFFCGMMTLQLLFVWKIMPETKGTSLESVDAVPIMH